VTHRTARVSKKIFGTLEPLPSLLRHYCMPARVKIIVRQGLG